MILQFKGGSLDGQFETVADHLISPDLSITLPATDKGEPQQIYRFHTSLDGVSPPVLMLDDESDLRPMTFTPLEDRARESPTSRRSTSAPLI